MKMADSSQTRIRLILDAQTLLHFGRVKAWDEDNWEAGGSHAAVKRIFDSLFLVKPPPLPPKKKKKMRVGVVGRGEIICVIFGGLVLEAEAVTWNCCGGPVKKAEVVMLVSQCDRLRL